MPSEAAPIVRVAESVLIHAAGTASALAEWGRAPIASKVRSEAVAYFMGITMGLFMTPDNRNFAAGVRHPAFIAPDVFAGALAGTALRQAECVQPLAASGAGLDKRGAGTVGNRLAECRLARGM